MTNKNMLLLTSALVAFATYGSVAHAQAASAAATAQAAQSTDTQVSDVIVTVNKREEKVEDVPVAVTAFSAEQRDLLGVVSIFDMTRATPSFEYSTTLDRSFIRGVGRNTNAPGTQAGVAVYVDGVYTSSTYGLDRAPIMSGTFEVDAGPQGTLFGRNAIGGVLQQNSAHATDHFETQVDLRYNDHQRFDEAVTIGGPINQNLKLIVGADIRNQKEGYFHNLALPNDDTGGPTSERLYYGILDFNWGKVFDGFFKIESSGFNRKLSGYSQYGSAPSEVNPLFNDYSTSATALNLNEHINCQAKVGPAAGQPGSFFSTTNPLGYDPSTVQLISNSFSKNGYQSLPLASCPATQPQATTYYNPANPSATNTFLINQDYRTFAKSHDNWNTALQNTFHLPGVDVKYIGGYNQYVYDNRQDGDGTARGAFVYDPNGPANLATSPAVTMDPIVGQYLEVRHWYSHELNISNSDHGKFNWILGAYYYNDSFHNITDSYSPGQNELATTYVPYTFNTVQGAINPNHDYYDLDSLALTQTRAVFGQFDYAFNDKWKFTGGLRWNNDSTQTVENDHYFVFVPGTTGGVIPGVYNGGYSDYVASKGQYATSDVTNLFSLGANCNPVGVPAVQRGRATCSTNINPAQGLNDRLINDAWDGWGATANLSYQPNEDTLAYIKWSRGYKAGGIVLSSMNVQPILNPEVLYSYEGGFKFNPSRKVTVNLSAYYYDYRNYQDFGSIVNPNSRTGFSTVGFNIPKSRNYGAEFTLDWHPIHAFTLTASGDYLNAKVTDGTGVYLADSLDPLALGTVLLNAGSANPQTLHYTPQPCGAPTRSTTAFTTTPDPAHPGAFLGVITSQTQCITGDALKGASPWKVWVNGDYRVDFSKGSLDLIANYSLRAGNVSTYSKDPVYKAPSYGEADLRIVWQGTGKKYQLIGFVDNVFNKVGTEYVTAAADASQPVGSPASIYLNNQLTIPRTWGIELQAKF
jgi:iron complex outermembrane receptor protein